MSASVAPTIHALFEAQVAATPDAVAVVYEGEQLTYAELNARANQLARYLRTRGVRVSMPVGLCVERSQALHVGMLGILKAGGAYVPLDPSYPAERLALMLGDSGATVLVTQQSLRSRLPETEAAVVEWTAPEIAAESPEPIESGATADSLAYVLYTSGSTGRPKGVAGPHRVVPHLVLDSNYITLTPEDVVAQVSNVSFDAATFEIWGALLNGARQVVLPQDTVLSPPRLAEALREHGITTLFLTTSLFNHVAYERPSTFAPLHTVIFGGERADPGALREVLHADPPDRLINVYGPTEATTFTTWHLVREITDETPVPIGIPVTGTTLWVLDEQQQPVPAREPGELYIGGSGVADGYLHRPELTAERFLPDPFSPDPDSRLYRTGDRVRQRPDGTYDFLARLDRQVKLRGFRIELPEIEAALGRHPKVQGAAVLVVGEVASDRRLAAFVGTGTATVPGAELRAALEQKLPPYMVPSVFITMEALPLTPNGKVDYRALPDPACARSAMGEDFESPRTGDEETLAAIWAEVLGLERVGVHDSFYDLGGHSLLAVRIVARVREQLGADLPVSFLFEHPTVAELAEALVERDGADVSADAIPKVGAERAPLSFAQERLWVVDQLQPGSPLYNVAGAFRLSGKLDRTALQQALNAVVVRHEALRSHFVSAHGEPEQVVDPPRPVELSEWEANGDAEFERGVREEARRPFDLSRDLMLRAALVRLPVGEHGLLLVVHHIAVDGWSLPILHREISTFYEAFVNGTTPTLPPLPVQYSDFATWQRRTLGEGETERHLAYWKQQLRGDVPVLQMPTDTPRPSVLTHRGARQGRSFGEELGAEVRALSRREGVTPFMLLLAAYEALLHHITAQTDFAVGINTAGRGRRETENLVGFFVNLLVLRADLGGDPTFRELLGRVRETALGAYAHQDVPFGLVLDAVQPRRDPATTPLVQTVFSLQQGSDFELHLAGLDSEPLAVHTQTAKFDLVMDVIEDGDALRGSLEYNTDCYSIDTADGLLRQYEAVLRAALGDPEITVDALGRAVAEAEQAHRAAQAESAHEANLRSLRSTRRRAVRS